MPKIAWMPLSVLIVMMSLTACQRETSSLIVVTPEIVEYAPEVQQRALEELNELGHPCLPNEVTPDCSALRTFINDYKHLRDKIRAAQ